MLVLIVCGLLPAIAIQCYARFTSSGTATATKTLVLDHISKLCVSSHAVSCHCTLLRVRASQGAYLVLEIRCLAQFTCQAGDGRDQRRAKHCGRRGRAAGARRGTKRPDPGGARVAGAAPRPSHTQIETKRRISATLKPNIR